MQKRIHNTADPMLCNVCETRHGWGYPCPIPDGSTLLTYDQAIEQSNDEQRFRATVYAMNTLLIGKGYYSSEEFRFQFRQSIQKQLRKLGQLEGFEDCNANPQPAPTLPMKDRGI